ncbi:MAG: DUF4836 family protein [Bacteroidota bacterium]
MKRFSIFASLFVLLIGIAVFFTQCKNDIAFNDDSLSYLPADVSNITAFRPAQLMQKADFESIKTQTYYKDMLEEAKGENPAIARLLSDPYQSGVDLEQPVYIAFSDLPGASNNRRNYVLMSLKDAQQFEQMIREVHDGEIISNEQYKMIQHEEAAVIAWNDQVAMASSGHPYVDIDIAERFGVKGKSNLAENSNLRAALSKDFDLMTWMHTNELANDDFLRSNVSAIGLDPDVLKDNYLQTMVQFDEGELSSTTRYDIQSDLRRELNLFFKDKVKTDFHPYVPAKDLGIAFSVALDFKGIKQVLAERPQAMGFLAAGLKEYDIKTQDLFDVLTGDLLLAAYPQGDQPSGLFIATIAQPELMQSLLEIAIEQGALNKIAEHRYAIQPNLSQQLSESFGGPNNETAQLLIHNNLLFISANESLLQKIQQGPLPEAEQLTKTQYQLLSDQIFGALFHTQTLPFPEENGPLALIDHIETRTTRKQTNVRVRLKDGQSNSLKQFIESMVQQAQSRPETVEEIIGE